MDKVVLNRMIKEAIELEKKHHGSTTDLLIYDWIRTYIRQEEITKELLDEENGA